MEEKAYKVMSQTGGLNITLGVISILLESLAVFF